MVSNAFGQQALALVDIDDAVSVVQGVNGGLTFAIGLLLYAGGAGISPGGGYRSQSNSQKNYW